MNLKQRSLIEFTRDSDSDAPTYARVSLHDLIREFCIRFAQQRLGGEGVLHEQLLARYPCAIAHLQTAPSGTAWAGGVGNHLHIITLEGGKHEPSAQRPQQT